MDFSDILRDYRIDVLDHGQFVINALLAALLSWLLSKYYIRFGRVVGNRSRFSGNFMLLALTTMLIIYIVKSSIALSLGLVGALSIVRFRAAIKEPEELVYLFLVIGIGLGMGANQPGITILAFVLIMALLILTNVSKAKSIISADKQMVLHLASRSLIEDDINAILLDKVPALNLKRLSTDNGITHLVYDIEFDSMDQISHVKKALLEKDSELSFSLIDQGQLSA
jgi:hypothetical protein